MKLYIILTIIIISVILLFPLNPNTLCISPNSKDILNKDMNVIKISENIVYIEKVFKTDFFNNIKTKTLQIIDEDDSINKNILRQNKTISSSKLQNTILYDLYMNSNLKALLSSLVDKKLKNVDCDDLSWGNIISYSEPGDNIFWHNDPNHYKGSRFTTLVMVNNKSSMDLVYIHDNKEKLLRMSDNSLLIFDGSNVLHKTTKLEINQRRDLISYTYCDICQSTPFGNAVKYLKEILLGY